MRKIDRSYGLLQQWIGSEWMSSWQATGMAPCSADRGPGSGGLVSLWSISRWIWRVSPPAHIVQLCYVYTDLLLATQSPLFTVFLPESIWIMTIGKSDNLKYEVSTIGVHKILVNCCQCEVMQHLYCSSYLQKGMVKVQMFSFNHDFS